MAEGLALEEIEVGRFAERMHTVTEQDIQAFADVSGDHNPVHLDAAFAETTQFKGRIAHGMLSGAYISAAIAGDLPGPGSIYISQSMNFRRPVRIGDTVVTRVTVASIDLDKARVTLKTECLVNAKTVVEGEAVVMVPRKGASA
jgi:3-hydroxybutyryl-CoA dehydratase